MPTLELSGLEKKVEMEILKSINSAVKEATLPLVVQVSGLETEVELLGGQVLALNADLEKANKHLRIWRFIGDIGIGVTVGVITVIVVNIVLPNLSVTIPP